MLNKLILILVTLMATSTISHAANYIEAEELKQIIQQKKDVVIVDIQPGTDFEKHYLPGSIETNAFPAKTTEEKQRLDKALPVIAASKAPVVIICPRGKSGAKNSYEYLLTKGIPEERLLILEDGISGWPFKELLKQGR
jgi:rhodanese-related sulfurtransferase